MIFIIQTITICIAIFIVTSILGMRKSHSGKAWKKIGLIILAVAMVIGVLFPDLTNQIAHFFGIGRGADLLLYATSVSFIGYVLNSYLHRQDERDVVYRLGRKIAILEAAEKYKIDP